MGKKIVRLKESDLLRIVKRTIKENEQEVLMQTIESDPKMSRQFDKIVDYLSNLDPEEQEQIQDVALGGEEIQGEYTEGKRTVYKDYEPDRGPVEISKSEFVKRKLMSVLPASIVGAIMGIAMAGGMSADDVLQMALGTAAVTGGLGAGLISTVGRETVEVPDEEETDTEKKPMAESYRRKKVIKLTESDLTRIVKRIIMEQPVKQNVPQQTQPKPGMTRTTYSNIPNFHNLKKIKGLKWNESFKFYSGVVNGVTYKFYENGPNGNGTYETVAPNKNTKGTWIFDSTSTTPFSGIKILTAQDTKARRK